jgi:hypothetical protein
MGWSPIAGASVAALLLAAPAFSTEEAKKGSTASGASGAVEEEASAKESEARGSGQAGASTGARPGEVTGAPGEPGGTSAKEQRAAAGTQDQVSGKVEKYDREKRTLSLSGSEKKLKLSDDTQVMKDGARLSPGHIMEGDEVRASTSGTGEEVQVLVLEITPSAAAQGAAPSGSTADPGSGSGAAGGSPKGTGAGSSSETGSGSAGTKRQ